MINEHDIETALVRMVERNGGRCMKWVCPGYAGVPDRIILFHGRAIFVELKRPHGGRIAPLQKWWHDELIRLGFEHYFVRGKEEIDTLEMLMLMDG